MGYCTPDIGDSPGFQNYRNHKNNPLFRSRKLSEILDRHPDKILFPDRSYDPDYGVRFPNSGYLNVTVTPEKVKVDYIRSFLPKDEVNGHLNGELAYSYTLPPEKGEKGMDCVCPPSAKGKGKGNKGKGKRK